MRNVKSCCTSNSSCHKTPISCQCNHVFFPTYICNILLQAQDLISTFLSNLFLNSLGLGDETITFFKLSGRTIKTIEAGKANKQISHREDQRQVNINFSVTVGFITKVCLLNALGFPPPAISVLQKSIQKGQGSFCPLMKSKGLILSRAPKVVFHYSATFFYKQTPHSFI